jgi:ribosomal protein S16
VLGTYDPIPKPDPYDSDGKMHKDIRLDMIRARYWIGVGAQPSDTCWRLLSMVRAGCGDRARWLTARLVARLDGDASKNNGMLMM